MVIHRRRIRCGFILAGAAVGCYWSVGLARADWLAGRSTVAATAKSIELAPDNSAYLRHAAEIREAEGLPAAGLRERAARINPLDSHNWIHIATRAEMEGRIAESERDLLRAYDVDRQFEPRWALANFYFRQGDRQRALDWARRTLEFGGGDLMAVFQLSWTASGNAGENLYKAVTHRVEVLSQYLTFLDAGGHLDEAGDGGPGRQPLASSGQTPMLVAACARGIEEGKAGVSAAVWDRVR